MGPGGLRSYARSSYGVELTQKEADRYWCDFCDTYLGLKIGWHYQEYRKLKKRGNTETLTLAGRRRTSIKKLIERLDFSPARHRCERSQARFGPAIRTTR
jgi:hypothetical protein